MIPKKVFFTSGIGVHKDKLVSFEAALRSAGIQKCNLVYVSSILPPKCQIISKQKGSSLLKSGQITFCVMSRNETNEPNRVISAAIGLAVPTDRGHHGYLSEHHSFGQAKSATGDYAEDLAATMLATTMGFSLNPDQAWDARKQIYQASGHIFKTSNIACSFHGDKGGKWTTVLSAAVFLLE